MCRLGGVDADRSGGDLIEGMVLGFRVLRGFHMNGSVEALHAGIMKCLRDFCI